jgi:hypothetical protein
MKDVE